MCLFICLNNGSLIQNTKTAVVMELLYIERLHSLLGIIPAFRDTDDHFHDILPIHLTDHVALHIALLRRRALHVETDATLFAVFHKIVLLSVGEEISLLGAQLFRKRRQIGHTRGHGMHGHFQRTLIFRTGEEDVNIIPLIFQIVIHLVIECGRGYLKKN